MEFRIADTFTHSLARLTGEEQKAVKTTAFDLQLNPASPGLSFHKLEKAKDRNFWSVRVNSDIRLIVHRSDANLLICYVDHHDNAYDWAERRKLETHPRTGAAQLVGIRETVKEVIVPVHVQTEMPAASRRMAANEVRLKQGVHPRTVMEILGHSDINLTMKTSRHVVPELMPAAATRSMRSSAQNSLFGCVVVSLAVKAAIARIVATKIP
jgi:mRNA-degrading endonuclease RelE of RelBE toxin-antitoxin system